MIIAKDKFSKLKPHPFPKITNTYFNIFTSNGQAKLNPSYTYFNSYRAPIASYLTKDNLYILLVYKIDNIGSTKTLKGVVKLINQEVKLSDEVIYDRSFGQKYVYFYNANSTPQKAQSIYFYINGDRIKSPVLKDSIQVYNHNYKNFAIKYEVNGIVEVFSTLQNKFKLFTGKIPIQIIFKKKQDDIYMICVFPNDIDKAKQTDLSNYFNYETDL